MAKSIPVLLSFENHSRLEKMRNIGKEHHMTTQSGELKNATIAMNIINFIIEKRHDPTYSQIIEREGIPILHLMDKALLQYAASKGYKIKKNL